MIKEAEIWKEIKGFEGIYEISSDGRCRKISTMRYLIAHKNDDGYLRYSLFDKNKKRLNARINRLIAITFIPNPNNLPQVNHIDGNILNNEISNLEWVNNSQNQLHAYKLGLQPRQVGSTNGNFISIIAAFDSNGKQVETFDGPKSMKEKGYTSCCIYDCLTGKQKTHKNLTYKRI